MNELKLKDGVSFEMLKKYRFYKTKYLWYAVPRIGTDVVFILFNGFVRVDKLYHQELRQDPRVHKNYLMYRGSVYKLLCELVEDGLIEVIKYEG